MKIKTSILLSVTLWFFVALSACKEDPVFSNDNFTLTSVSPLFDGNTIAFDSESQTVIIDVNTEIPSGKWQYSYAVNEVWFAISRIGNSQLSITVKQNDTYFPRSAYINVLFGDKVQHIAIRQRENYQLAFADGLSKTLRGGKGIVTLPLLTNIAPDNLSLTISPANCSWINPFTIGNNELSFAVTQNTTTYPRQATLTLTCENRTATITLTQLISNNYSYVIDLSGADFTNCYIYEIWDDTNNKKIGELCKEYLYKKSPDGFDIVRKQTAVAYPVLDGKTDLSNGLVVENGFFVAWNPKPSAAVPTNILASYTPGEDAWQPTVIYLDADAYRMTTIEPEPGDRINTTLKPYLVHDLRTGPNNNMSTTVSTVTDWGVQRYSALEEEFTYRVVKIGTQYWMTENLRTSRYRDGTNIPTSIATANTGIGIPLCIVAGYYNESTSGSNSTNANSTTATYVGIRFDVGPQYTYNAIVDQTCVSKLQALATPRQDLISPAGWAVPERAQFEMLRNYTAQSTANTNIIPELAYRGEGDYGNATGFSLRNSRYRQGNNVYVGNVTLLAAMEYFHDISQATDYDAHRRYCLRMAAGASFNVTSTGTNYYACSSTAHIRCIRQE